MTHKKNLIMIQLALICCMTFCLMMSQLPKATELTQIFYIVAGLLINYGLFSICRALVVVSFSCLLGGVIVVNGFKSIHSATSKRAVLSWRLLHFMIYSMSMLCACVLNSACFVLLYYLWQEDCLCHGGREWAFILPSIWNAACMALMMTYVF